MHPVIMKSTQSMSVVFLNALINATVFHTYNYTPLPLLWVGLPTFFVAVSSVTFVPLTGFVA